MKTKQLFLAAAFTFIAVFSFGSNEPTNHEKIRNEVANLIMKSEWNNAQEFIVTFYVNSKNEIIVNSTNNKDLDHQVKSLLNYKTIKSSNPVSNELFILPVRIK